MLDTQPAQTDNDAIVSDDALIDMALRGEKRGYEQLIRRYQDRLYTSIWGLVGCPLLAEDVVQESFVQAIVNLGRFRRQSQFYSWLYRIAINSWHNHLRKNRGTVPLHSVASDAGQDRASDDPRTSPADFAELCERRRLVREAIGRLDENHRKILLLREFDGLSYEEIANVLDLNIGTVRSRIFRARSILKRELLSYYMLGS